MSARRVVALTLALLATACSTNGTQTVPGLATGDDRLAADKSPATLIRIADATRAGGDPGSAIGLYQSAHEVAPKDPVPLARLGATFTEIRAYNEAASAFRQAVELAPNDPELRRGLATVLLAIDKPGLALTQLDASLAMRKEPRTYNLLGVAHDLIGQHDVAQQQYAEGLRLAPDNLPLRNNLGLSQALSGAFEMAVATLSAATESPKATARTRQNLALVYGLAGESDKAAAVARADLDAASIKSNLAYYAMLRGMDDRARAAAIIGAHTPAGEQAAAAPPAPVQKAEIAAVPVEPVEKTPLAMPTAPATPSQTRLAAQKFEGQKLAPVAPAAAPKDTTVRATQLAVASSEAPHPADATTPPAPLQAAAAPASTVPEPTQVAGNAMAAETPRAETPRAETPRAETPRAETAELPPKAEMAAVAPQSVEPSPAPAVVAVAAVDAPRPEWRMAQPEPKPEPEPQTAAIASRPAEPAAAPAVPAAATAEAARPEQPMPQIAAAAPPAEPAPQIASTVASSASEPPAASDPAPLAAAVVPDVTSSDAALSATSAPTLPADPFSLPVSGAAAERHGFVVQVGAFHDETKAQKLCRHLTTKGYAFSVSTSHSGASQDWFFCRSSDVADHAEATAMAQRLHAKENTTAFLVPTTVSLKN